MTFVFTVQQFLVVPGYYSCHVGHTAVAQFDVVTVAHFVQTVMGWEVPGEQIEEFLSDIIGNVLAIGWVEPNDVAFSELLFGARIVDVIYPPGIPALLQGFFVWWQGFGKMLAIAGNLRDALCQHRRKMFFDSRRMV